MERRSRAAVALGSGGARGYAHIGAIQVIEEQGFEIVSVAGASMGALIGGLYAAGELDRYTEWVSTFTRLDVVRLLDFSLSAPGVIRAERIFAKVRELIGDVAIEDLPLPFTAVASDLFARKAVWLQRGPLEMALRASIALPGMFPPVTLNGRVLVDGGLMDPVPIAPTASVRADVTIAVDLGGEPRGWPDGGPAFETAEERPTEEWIERFRRGTSHLLDRDLVRSLLSRFAAPSSSVPLGDAPPPLVREPALLLDPSGADDDRPPSPGGSAAGGSSGGESADSGPLPFAVEAGGGESHELSISGLSKFEVMNQSLQAMQTVLTRYRLAANPPGVLVTIPRNACHTLDFHRAPDMIALGRALTIEALDRAGLVS
jgi:NTE family protein